MNVILIISDTYRYDNLFDRASMPVRTPNLDDFASRAASVERFYTASFPTIPQRTDLTTGRIGWPWYPWQDLAKSSANAMPRILKQGGYVSQLICDCPHLFNTGFQHTFDAAYSLRGQEGDLYMLRMNEEIEEVMPPEKTRTGHHFRDENLVNLHRWQNMDWRYEQDCLPPRTARHAVQWLEDNYEFDPFFLWVDFFDPHEPWDPPEYLVRRYDAEYDGVAMLHPNYGKASDLTEEELRNLRAHYCAEAELVDRWVGRILQKIDDLQLWDDSIVIFTTDHGMSLGEHNRTGKSNINDRDERHWPIYPEIGHIPFMIAGPDIEGGTSLDLIAHPVDILPTVAELAGVEIEPPEELHGVSFAPQLRGESDDDIREFAISASFLRMRGDELPAGAVTPAIYDREWGYVPVGADGEEELYDITEDPYAERNIVDDNPDVAAEMHAKMIGELERLEAPEEAFRVFEK